MLEAGCRPKVLVVEDEEYLAKLLRSRLMLNRLEVINVFDGESGLREAEQGKPDLIILDVLIPKIRGDEFVKVLRSTESIKNIPVIVISAMPESKTLFAEGSISCFIQKPFKAEELIAKVKSLLPNTAGH